MNGMTQTYNRNTQIQDKLFFLTRALNALPENEIRPPRYLARRFNDTAARRLYRQTLPLRQALEKQIALYKRKLCVPVPL